MKSNLVKVTTTSGFEGVKIEEYLEPVTAHVVVGMNIFKDFFAGITDFFGGRSETYQNVLSYINQEVINELRKKAFALGGNCILSMKIDNDEISAKDKSMMMVSAVGTAARAKINASEKQQLSRISVLGYNEFNYLKRKKQYIRDSQNNTLRFDDEFWNFIKVNRVDELVPFIVDKYIQWISSGQYLEETTAGITNNVEEYLQVVNRETVIEVLYDRFVHANFSDTTNKLYTFLNNLHLVDYSKVIDYLGSDDFKMRKSAIQLLDVYKYSYTREDADALRKIIALINQTFHEKGTRSTKKKVLSSKEKEIWVCECGRENDAEDYYCTTCRKDIYGFSNEELNPVKAVEKLQIELEILEETLS